VGYFKGNLEANHSIRGTLPDNAQFSPKGIDSVKVLMADDSILIRRSLVKLVDRLDNVTHVAEATNVPEAIRMAKEFKPDIIILDIRMPGGTGFDVLKYIRKQSARIMVIILTKYSTDAFREEAMINGADYFFDKSTEFENVIDVIKGYQNT
jgi:DNA-binding NarL/FixJ family response regulator